MGWIPIASSVVDGDTEGEREVVGRMFVQVVVGVLSDLASPVASKGISIYLSDFCEAALGM